MKSTILKAAAILAISAIGYTAKAEDSFLYWMLGETISSPSESNVSYDYAKVSFNGTYLSMYEGATAISTEISSALAGTPAYWGTVTGNSGTFVFELWSDSNTSTPLHTAQLSFEAARSFIGNSRVAHTAYTLSRVPEPTSGLLMLIGMAGLALRRRKVA